MYFISLIIYAIIYMYKFGITCTYLAIHLVNLVAKFNNFVRMTIINMHMPKSSNSSVVKAVDWNSKDLCFILI